MNAFGPVYKLTQTLQKKHVSLNEFYLQWLKTIYEVEKVDSPFSKPLSLALKERLKKLTENYAFKAAIFLDPRLNFPGSTIFKTGDEKESVQVNMLYYMFCETVLYVVSFDEQLVSILCTISEFSQKLMDPVEIYQGCSSFYIGCWFNS